MRHDVRPVAHAANQRQLGRGVIGVLHVEAGNRPAQCVLLLLALLERARRSQACPSGNRDSDRRWCCRPWGRLPLYSPLKVKMPLPSYALPILSSFCTHSPPNPIWCLPLTHVTSSSIEAVLSLKCATELVPPPIENLPSAICRPLGTT